MSDYDVIIAGGSHNGLACGAYLSLYGLKVLVAERNPWVGGGAVTEEIVMPGFKHDLFSSSHIFIHMNPCFTRELRPELEKHGLEYLWAEDEITGHPYAEGPGIVLYKDLDKTVESIAEYSARDARTYRQIVEDFDEIKDGFTKAIFSPPIPPSLQPAAMENSPEGLRRLREFQLSLRAFTEEKFENKYVRSMILGWSLAPHTRPDQEGMGGGFYVMVPSIHYFGQAIPKGGSQELPNSMVRLIESKGGKVLNNATINKLIINRDECLGFQLEDGAEITAKHGVVTALDPKQTFLRLIEPGNLSDTFLNLVQNFKYSEHGICRVHYALNEAPEFKSDILNGVPFHRIFGTVDEIRQQFAELELHQLPTQPCLIFVNWTLRDPSRAPEGKHTLSLDTVVPAKIHDGRQWDEVKEDYAGVMLEQAQKYTTNLDDNNILGYAIHTPEDLFRYNRSFINGCPTGGERTIAQWGYFRPFPGYSQYKSPIKKLYMTGPACHPGNGISAMGTITANVILRDLKLKAPSEV